MKSTWIQKYLDSSNRKKWKEFFELEFAKFGGNLIFKGNLNKVNCSKIIPGKKKKKKLFYKRIARNMVRSQFCRCHKK